ncbi:baseplate wedge initiator [Klebsiella phage vB_Kpn_P545]|uniref:Baseplate wedge protein gp7 n=1 Tax=Klebsiella phage vB_Kpn_P545 TaxID=2686283 RepID=A0A6B9J856_9CAUD|nr:baseplate wedge initiator [Klebsiella phage vB_Kpn_P545]
MTIAPFVTSLRIHKLSANQVNIRWDDVGANFYYFVEIAEIEDETGRLLDRSSLSWRALGYTTENEWFANNLRPMTTYRMRVQSTAAGFEPSEWVETEDFETFEVNAYTFEQMSQFMLMKPFIEEKFIKNRMNYVNFNTAALQASLMAENFPISTEYKDLSQVKQYVLGEDEFHEIQGPIEAVCVDKDRTMLAEIDGNLYLFERFQHMVKVSNDKGQNWHYVRLFSDRVGNPVSRTCVYQSNTTTYVLGYNKVFYGRKSSDVRWSSDEVRFSDNEVTFTKLGDQLNLGFEVEIFGVYASWPGILNTRVEAMTVNNTHLYGVARDTVRRIKLKQAPVDTVIGSPTFGEKLFEPEIIRITGDDLAVCYKMDSIGGKIFALITGRLKSAGLDASDPKNVECVSKEAEAIKGVYVFDEDTLSFRRVFGTTAEERRRIEHGWSSMSTDGQELFFSSGDFRYNEYVPDNELPLEYPAKVTEAISYYAPYQYHHDKHWHMMSFRSNENSGWEEFKPGRMKFYAEPWFNWMARSGNRNWATTTDHALVVYNNTTYTKYVDTLSLTDPNRILHEVWNKGDGVFYCPNVEFDSFLKYASGIMFHEPDGTLVGFYEFEYRVRDYVKITWKPKNVMFKAFLQNQEHEVPWTPTEDTGLQDPDLVPLVRKMMPDSYLLQDTNFEAFSNYYLQFISKGYGTHYNKLLNLVRDKYPREEHAWEYLWSEVYKRNIYLSKDQRDAVVRFFEARKNDFYATKGIEESYQFLFKLLYNEDVEIDIESKNSTEYDIVVDSDNINDDIVGRTIYTASGRCNVTYIEREYVDGKLLWRMTIHNMIGRFIAGQEVKSEKTSFEGMIVVGVRGKELISNTIEYINRSRSYYVMKIRSSLPTSRYRDDVLRFVHPVGFGFIGITLITMFINSGLSMKHVETTINKLKNYKWDSGIPSYYPDRNAAISPTGTIERDAWGDPIYYDNVNKGVPYPCTQEYITENNNSQFQGQGPCERRKRYSPLFDQSAVTFSCYRELVDERLKDNVGNPRDPENPTQVNIGE